MPNKKITAMPSLGGNQVPTDLVTAVDLSAAPVNQNVKSTLNDLFSTITKNITDRAIRFQAPGSAPAVSSANQGALYHNGTAFLASSNGGAFEQLYTLSAQSAALVFAGPIAGQPAALPSFRALQLTDLPDALAASLYGRNAVLDGKPQIIPSTANVLNWLQTPSSANLSLAVTDGGTGTGALVLRTGPQIEAPYINSIRVLTLPNTLGGSVIRFAQASGGGNNCVELVNAANNGTPILRAFGSSDINVSLNLSSKGSGNITLSGAAIRAAGSAVTEPGIFEARGGNQTLGGGKILFYEQTTNGNNFVGFEAPDIISTSIYWTLPATDGSAGQALVTNGGGGLSWASNDAGLKNFLINGDMQIAQRGNTATAILTSGYYTADRWRTDLIVPGPNGQFTQSIGSGAGDYPDNSGFRRSLKIECSQTFSTPLGSTAECRIEQRIEGQNCLPINFGQSGAAELTLSFWVKSSNTGVFIAELIQPAGSVQVSAEYTINAANTWEKKSVTFPARTTGTLIANDNTYQLAAGFWLVAGSNYTSGMALQTTWGNTANRRARGQTNLTTSGNYLQITGIQLEIGAVATDFEYLPIDITALQCYRYFYATTQGGATSIQGAGNAVNTTTCGIVIRIPCPMRATPVTSLSDRSGWRLSEFAAAFNLDTGANGLANYAPAASPFTPFVLCDVTPAGSLTQARWYVLETANTTPNAQIFVNAGL